MRSMSASCMRITDSSHATASRRAAGPSTRASIKNERKRSANAFAFSKVPINQDEALTILERALPGNCTSCSAAGADYEHSKIPQIDREFAANCAQESFTISIRSDQSLIDNTNCVYGSDATCGLIRFIDLPKARNFVRYRQVHSYEVQISQKTESRSQFIRSDMKTRVLSIDLAASQGGSFAFRAKASAQRDRQRHPGESVDQCRVLSHSTFQGRRAYNVAWSQCFSCHPKRSERPNRDAERS